MARSPNKYDNIIFILTPLGTINTIQSRLSLSYSSMKNSFGNSIPQRPGLSEDNVVCVFPDARLFHPWNNWRKIGHYSTLSRLSYLLLSSLRNEDVMSTWKRRMEARFQLINASSLVGSERNSFLGNLSLVNKKCSKDWIPFLMKSFLFDLKNTRTNNLFKHIIGIT